MLLGGLLKALVLAAGRGRRLEELTRHHNKCMLSLDGRPILDRSLDAALLSGAGEIVLVVGYQAEEIVSRYGTGHRDRPLIYVHQSEQRGIVHAMECAREALSGEDFMLFLGDEVMARPRVAEMVQAFLESGAFALCGVLAVEDPRRVMKTYGLVPGEDGLIREVIEKPEVPPNRWMGTGVCLFKNGILAYVPETPIHPGRGEKELPALIQTAIDHGRPVRMFEVCDDYRNVNLAEDFEPGQSELM